MSRDYDHLFPKERAVLTNEYFREKLIQERLAAAIEGDRLRASDEAEMELKKAIAKSFMDNGFTVEEVENANNDPEVKAFFWDAIRINVPILLRISAKRLLELFEITKDDLKELEAKMNERE